MILLAVSNAGKGRRVGKAVQRKAEKPSGSQAQNGPGFAAAIRGGGIPGSGNFA